MKSKTIFRPAAIFGAAFLLASSLFWLKISLETPTVSAPAPTVFPQKSVEMAVEVFQNLRP